jgi:hypothetical protein
VCVGGAYLSLGALELSQGAAELCRVRRGSGGSGIAQKGCGVALQGLAEISYRVRRSSVRCGVAQLGCGVAILAVCWLA